MAQNRDLLPESKLFCRQSKFCTEHVTTRKDEKVRQGVIYHMRVFIYWENSFMLPFLSVFMVKIVFGHHGFYLSKCWGYISDIFSSQSGEIINICDMFMFLFGDLYTRRQFCNDFVFLVPTVTVMKMRMLLLLFVLLSLQLLQLQTLFLIMILMWCPLL